jgi:hypothetical protein
VIENTIIPGLDIHFWSMLRKNQKK